MKNKGFTLIELLAVIIILGILMIIAIPSVTNYIQNSRKEAYIKSALSIIKSATNEINSGKYEAYDTNVTYYLPASCISLENQATSPFGDWKESYVVVTYNGNKFDYYWTSLDTSGTGVYLTYADKLDMDRIYFNLKEIPTDATVGARSTIIKFTDCNVTDIDEIEANSIVEDESYYDPEKVILINNYKAMFTQGYRFQNILSNNGINKSEVVAIKRSTTLDETKNPFRIDCLSQTPNDASCREYDKEIYAWYDNDAKTLYWYSVALKPSVNYMSELQDNQDVEHNYFYGFTALVDISGVKDFDLTKTDGIVSMFDGCSSLTDISSLNKWDTSTIKYTRKTFRSSGITSIESIKNWNTSNFLKTDEMFKSSKVENFKPLENWDISNFETSTNIFALTPTNRNIDLVPYDSWLSQKSGWSWNWNYSSFASN